MTEYSLTVLTPKYPPDTGGAARYFDLITDFLVEEEDVQDVSVVTTTQPDLPKVENDGNISVYRVLPDTAVDSPVNRLARFLLKQVILLIVLGILAVLPGRRVVQTHSTVLYAGRHRFNVVLDSWIALLQCFSSVVFILDLRDQYTIPGRTRGVYAFICASESIRDRLPSNSVNSTKVVNLPVPIDITGIREHAVETTMNAELPSSYVCYVGDISSRKGTNALVNAASSRSPSTHLVLVGEPVDVAARDLLQSLPDGVTYLGSLSHEETLQVIDKASALILASESEGMPRVVLEAITLGTPIALSATVSELESDDSILKLKDRSADTLADIFENPPQERSNYSINDHDITRVGAELVNYHLELLENSGGWTR